MKNSDEAEYQRLLRMEHSQEVIEMEMTWSAQSESRARQAGEQSGRKAVVLRLLKKRFGAVPEEAQKRLNAMSSTEELEALAENLLTASSLEELGLL